MTLPSPVRQFETQHTDKTQYRTETNWPDYVHSDIFYCLFVFLNAGVIASTDLPPEL